MGSSLLRDSGSSLLCCVSALSALAMLAAAVPAGGRNSGHVVRRALRAGAGAVESPARTTQKQGAASRRSTSASENTPAPRSSQPRGSSARAPNHRYKRTRFW